MSLQDTKTVSSVVVRLSFPTFPLFLLSNDHILTYLSESSLAFFILLSDIQLREDMRLLESVGNCCSLGIHISPTPGRARDGRSLYTPEKQTLFF